MFCLQNRFMSLVDDGEATERLSDPLKLGQQIGQVNKPGTAPAAQDPGAPGRAGREAAVQAIWGSFSGKGASSSRMLGSSQVAGRSRQRARSVVLQVPNTHAELTP